MTNTVTKKDRVLEALKSNRSGLTPAQMEARFRVGNPSATINDLRDEGVSIVTEQRTDSKGRTRTFYCLGR